MGCQVRISAILIRYPEYPSQPRAKHLGRTERALILVTGAAMRRLRPNTDGARAGNAVVEVAIVLAFLLMVLFGIIDFGRAWWNSNIMHTACREGARLAAVSAQAESSAVITRIRDVLSTAAINPDPSDIRITWPALGDPLSPVTVQINYDFELIAGPILGVIPGTIPLSARCVMKYEAFSSP